LAWLVGSALSRAHRERCVGTAVDELASVFRTSTLGMGTLAVVAVALGLAVPRWGVVPTALVATLAVALLRMVVRWWLRLEHRQRWAEQPVLIVGAGHEGRAIVESFDQEPGCCFRAIGFADDERPPGTSFADLPVVGPVHLAVERARDLGATGLVITGSLGPLGAAAIVRAGHAAGLDVQLSSQLPDVRSRRLVPHPGGRQPLVRVEPTVRQGWRAGAKRSLDIGVAGSALLVLSPILLVAMVLVRRDSPGPALFRQTRVGRDGTPFTILKLRTMVVDAEEQRDTLLDRNEADGPLFKLTDDPRVTRVGRVLRKLSIDELPQLLNVVVGDMSLVGPRPALPDEVDEWPEGLDERLRVRPGITGLWQISGRSDCSFDDYARYDLYYVDNWSLATDLAILVRTVPLVVLGSGAR
jgi:exopolysaccharide biosynthesis polyprenyl glycosylphosphotransferase